MEEALEALTGACEVYRNAGMVHRVASFQDRIEKIKALIAMINGHRSSV